MYFLLNLIKLKTFFINFNTTLNEQRALKLYRKLLLTLIKTIQVFFNKQSSAFLNF